MPETTLTAHMRYISEINRMILGISAEFFSSFAGPEPFPFGAVRP